MTMTMIMTGRTNGSHTEQVETDNDHPIARGGAEPQASRNRSQALDDQIPPVQLASLFSQSRRHRELDLQTLAYHLQQSDATAADGYCHAAINEARSALEALVFGIVRAVGGNGAKRTAPGSRTPFSNQRRLLVEAGFLDTHESDLLHFAYSLSSEKGSHHGVTDEAWTRLTRRIVLAASQYLVHRYTTWKRNGRKVAPSADNRPQAPPRPWLPRIIATLLRKR